MAVVIEMIQVHVVQVLALGVAIVTIFVQPPQTVFFEPVKFMVSLGKV